MVLPSQRIIIKDDLPAKLAAVTSTATEAIQFAH
jgi:hypothetical protein